ncbi:MAG: hypothetical protein QM767_17215 [Anaeromyxobacter sp.]
MVLRPGYNVVAAEGAVLRRLLEALLCPDPHDAESLPRPQAPGGGAPRAGLTLVGDDKVTYRLVRDFAAGAQLHRFDAEKRAFALVSQDLKEIAAFLRQAPGVPPLDRMGALLTLSAADLPSRAGGGGLGGAGAAAALAPPPRTALSPEQLKKRLAQLQDELRRARVAEKLQADLDELQSRTFKLDEVLRVGTELKDGLRRAEEARGELEPLAQAAATLGDPAARLAAFQRATGRREEALARVTAEREALDEIEAAGAPGPLWNEPQLWVGVGAAAALVTVGVIGAAMDSALRYVMLLDVFGLGWGALAALRWVGALERWERTGRKRRVIDDWQAKIDAQYERDSGEVKRAMQACNVTKPADLLEALGRVEDADQVVADWRRRVGEWEANPEAAGARAQRAELDAQVKAIEAKLAGEAGGFVRDVRSIEAEIQRLESEAAAPPAPAAPASAPAPARPAGPAVEPLRGLLDKAAAALGGSPSGAARTVAQKASQAIAGLSFQRFNAIQVDDRGGIHAVQGGRTTPAMTLPPADRDLVYVALKLAFMEHALQGARRVALIEDAFGGLSDGSRRFAARIIKQLARNGQVVHGTSDAAFREAADHSA